jgi:cytochrome c553
VTISGRPAQISADELPSGIPARSVPQGDGDYFASEQPPFPPPPTPVASNAILARGELLATKGDAAHDIPACASCHGTSVAKLGTPWLDGQSAVYIKAQLQAFATGARQNDISEQMRNIARQMTAAEIDEAARYYAGRP